MLSKILNTMFFTFLSRITRPTQLLYATLLVGCFFDCLYFVVYSSFVRANTYTVLHFCLDILVVFILLNFYIEAVPRDIFFSQLEIVLRPYTSKILPNWVFYTIDQAPYIQKAMILRSYFLTLIFFSDCVLITLKILYFGCLVYFRIHFALSFILLVFFFISLRVFYRLNIRTLLSTFKQIEGEFVNDAINEIIENPKLSKASVLVVGVEDEEVEIVIENDRPIVQRTVAFEQHPYHIVQNSILPFLTSFSVFDTLSYTVKYFHNGMLPIIKFHLVIGTILLCIAIIAWLWAIVQESTDGHHTLAVRWNLVHGFILFIVSEIMLFFSIFWAFFHSSLSPSVAIYCAWPPLGIIPILWNKAPLLNTSLLVISGIWLTAGHFSLLARRFELTSAGLIWTLSLGSLFTLVQLFEYVKSKFSINDGVYGSIFFLATGFHGLHVIVGSIMLAVALLRNSLRQFLATQHIGFSTASWYWHFVDVVWLLLFLSVYWWGGL